MFSLDTVQKLYQHEDHYEPYQVTIISNALSGNKTSRLYFPTLELANAAVLDLTTQGFECGRIHVYNDEFCGKEYFVRVKWDW